MSEAPEKIWFWGDGTFSDGTFKYHLAIAKKIDETHTEYIRADKVEEMLAEQREATAPYDILLGNGDTIVTDIHNDEYRWAGICFSQHNCPVGEIYDTDAKTDIELEAFMRIITSNPDSLDVVIAACERAKVHLNAVEKKDEYTDINGTKYPRYTPVSDWHEYSVWDMKENRDLFPTKRGNRMRSSYEYCNKETAQKIADALNMQEEKEDDK